MTLETLTWLALGAWIVLATWWWWGMRRLPRLDGADDGGASIAEPPGGWPRLSLVVAARDEAATIEAALRTWLAQDYPSLEIVLVDDRSSDGTLDRARAVATERGREVDDDTVPAGPRMRFERVDALPEGWLGKVHAQARGVALAGGRWLLFADADVRLAPHALRAAMAEAVRSGVDHLALLPRFDAPRGAAGSLVLAFETAFALLLTLLTRPWRAPDRRSPTTLGIGAFGLYRRDAYERAGGHEAIRMRPDDDLALAAAVKRAGGASSVVFAPALAAVTWYATLGDAVRGLEKNAFAGLRFSLPLVGAVALALLATHVLPFAVALAGDGSARAAGVGVVLVVTVVYAWYGRRAATPAWYALLHPLSVTVLVWALLRSTTVTLRRGGIEWRGRRYPLSELRAARARDDEAAAPGSATGAAAGRRSVQTRNRPRT